MGGDDRKTEESKNEGDTYQAMVLEFLNQEIAGSAKSTDDPKVHGNEVDLLVDSLLKESITASDAMVAGTDSDFEDLDRLFSNLFGNQKDVLRGESKDARLELDPGCSTTLSEADSVETGRANLRPVENAPKREAADVPRCEVALPREAVSTEAARSSPQLLLVQEANREELKLAPVVATAETGARGPIPVFSLPEQRPPWNMQMLAVAIAFLCLLAGTGIVYLAGSKSPTPAMIQKPGPALPQTIPGKEGTALSTRDLPDPGTGVNTREQAAPSAPGAGTSPVSHDSNRLNSVAPSKAGKPAVNDSTASAVNSSPGAAEVASSATIEKSAPTVVPAADSSAANPPSHTAVSTSSVPSFQIQTAPVSTLAELIPKDAVDLVSLPPVSKPALQPPPMPSNAIPAVAISRVLPVYPEIARKSHIVGTVVLDVLIDEQGKVVKATPASGPVILLTEAANAVLRWRFKPATLNGVNVSSSTQVSIVFK